MQAIKSDCDYLLHLVRCALRNEQPMEISEYVSFDAVFDYAIKHEIANVAYYSVERLHKKPPEELLGRWRLRRDLAIERECNQNFARDEIVDEFQRLGIRSLEMQGTKIKTLYPLPEMRTMSDIDFIIDPEYLESAGEVLQNLGYTCRRPNEVEIDGFRPPNIHIELHTEYFPSTSDYHDCMRPPFESMDASGACDINELYIYNVLHIAKHYFCRGCGIRRVMDVYYLNSHFAEQIDRKYVGAVFQKAEVVDFARNISLLADYWFGDGKYCKCFDAMIRYITESTLHGTEQNGMSNYLRKTYDSDFNLVKLKHIVKRIFPGDDVMLRHYAFLKKWRILYPFCWMHRVIRASFCAKELGVIDEVKMIINADLRKK